jgi:Carbohydrate-selective porin, OprB family
MNHQLRMFHRTTPVLLSVTLCLGSLNAIASEKNEASFEAGPATLEAQQFSNNTKIDAEVVYASSDWKVRSLMELTGRYGCATGFNRPSPQTYGQFELASWLNTCLEQIGDRFDTDKDREIAQSLQQDFKSELAEIRNRTNELAARAATLEFNQFSPTSKLQGQTVITIQGGGF